jgi:AraC-like DNA-binding protein
MMKNLIEEIFYNIIIEVSSSGQRSYEHTNPIVSRAISYIDENLLTLSGIEEICNELYITKSHLHHLFKKYLKITPKKYITAKRLALAQREIYAGKKATDVCLKCGFSDYSAFFRAYKNHFGRCPTDSVNVKYMPDLKENIFRKI